MALYPAYESYKPTRCAWLAEIPEHWELKRIKNVATHNDETLDERTDPDFEIDYVDISSVSLTKGIEKSESMLFDKSPSRARRQVKDGDIIVSTVRTYLKAIAPICNPPENMVVSTGFAVVRPKENLDSGFAGYLLQSNGFVGEVVANSVGVSYPAINASDLVRIAAVEPPSDEQQAIARFLDFKTAQIDALIAKKQTLLDKLAEKRTTLISHAVTKGLDPQVKLKDSGVAWLGQIPSHWVCPPLYSRYTIELGKMLDESRISGKYLIPYLRNIDVQWDEINTQDLPVMDIRPDEFCRYLVQPGDLLVCEGGDVGRAAIVVDGMELLGYQKALHRLRIVDSSRENSRFMYYTLCWASGTGLFLADGNPNTIPHLTGEKLRRYRFPCPSIKEQRSIAEWLDKQCLRMAQQQNMISGVIERLQEYRSALITNAVTGKIDVRGFPIPISTNQELNHV